MKNRALLSPLKTCFTSSLVWKASVSRLWSWDAWAGRTRSQGCCPLRGASASRCDAIGASFGNNRALCLADVQSEKKQHLLSLPGAVEAQGVHWLDFQDAGASASHAMSDLAKVMQWVSDVVRDGWKSPCGCFSWWSRHNTSISVWHAGDLSKQRTLLIRFLSQ